MNWFYLALLIHLAFTWLMTGIVWFNQIIHFPLYRQIKEGFPEYEKTYIRRSGYFVGPLMLIEFITAVILFGWSKNGFFAELTSINLALLILIWVFTLLFQVNQHQKLSIKFSWKWYHGLVFSNWIRTLLWTARTLLMIFLLREYLG